jgi:predicted ATPase
MLQPMATRSDGFIRSVKLVRERVEEWSTYPFSIPSVRALDDRTEIQLHPKVTFLVGENGSGKSTLIEAIAVLAGFNPEGGTRNFAFSTRSSESALHRCLRLIRGTRRERTGFFFRAESYFNVATEMENLDREPAASPPVVLSYGGRYLHDQSHGESFLALIQHRFGPDGLYILDEPEAALSPSRQILLLSRIHELVTRGRSQFIIATHSPIVMAYPDAAIYRLSQQGIEAVGYEDTEHYGLTRDFLLHRERFFKAMFELEDESATDSEEPPTPPTGRSRRRNAR